MSLQSGEGHPLRPMRRQYCCSMPASLELVKIALQAYGNGDCEIALALADPLIRWDERASRADGDLVWKHDDVQRAMRRYLDSWESYRFDVEEIAEVGPGKVVAICRERGKPKEGVEVDRRFGGLWVVDGGEDRLLGHLPDAQGGGARRQGAAGRPASTRTRSSAGRGPQRLRRAPAPAAVPLPPEQPAVEAPSAEASGDDRPRKRPLTKSEEQKRAARARAKLRRRASQQTALAGG